MGIQMEKRGKNIILYVCKPFFYDLTILLVITDVTKDILIFIFKEDDFILYFDNESQQQC